MLRRVLSFSPVMAVSYRPKGYQACFFFSRGGRYGYCILGSKESPYQNTIDQIESLLESNTIWYDSLVEAKQTVLGLPRPEDKVTWSTFLKRVEGIYVRPS